MKKLIALLLLLVAIPVHGQITTTTVTITNTAGTSDGDTITVSSQVRTWKDSIAIPDQEISTAASIGGAATNLYNHYVNHPRGSPVLNVTQSGTNAVIFRSLPGATLTISLSSGWGTVSSSTPASTSTEVVRVPFDNISFNSNRVNQANQLVDGLNDYLENPFNGLVWSNGFAKGSVLTNVSLYATNGLSDGITITNTTAYITGGVISNASIINPEAIEVNTLRVTNSRAFIKIESSGLEDPGFLRITSWNDATPTGADETVGWLTFEGFDGTTNQRGGFILVNASSSDWSGSNRGAYMQFFAVPEGELGAQNLLTLHPWSNTNFGSLVITTNLTVGGQITEPVINAATLSGTNNVSGDVAFHRFDNSTLANGNNSAVDLNGQSFVKLSGPSGAFTVNGVAGGRNGKRVTLYNSTAQDMTIANDSGVDATAANRILTLTGGDITTTGTGAVTLIYDSAASRWIVESFRD